VKRGRSASRVEPDDERRLARHASRVSDEADRSSCPGHGGGEAAVGEAQARLLGLLAPIERRPECVPLAEAAGRILARDLVAGIPVPGWDNSAMDGYACRAADLGTASTALPVSQRIPVGVAPAPLAPGTAARIFTGAPIPQGADTVVVQEVCRESDGVVHIDRPPAAGANVRRAGEDLAQGAVALRAGRRLSPADIGVAASLGHAALEVAPPLAVAVLTTGDELVPPGQTPGPGQIYASNGPLLFSLLAGLGCAPLPPVHVPDSLAATRAALDAAALTADLLLTSGGVSVGEEDHVKAAVAALGVLDQWKVAIKPGKPLAFGRVRNTPFIGLPGNPVALFVTFALFAAPAIRRLQGRSDPLPEALPLAAGFDRPRTDRRDVYLRVRLQDGQLVPYPRQGAAILSSVAWADGLARVPAGSPVARRDLLDFYPMDALLT
jgi:molybdopterin molybdotransferase